jgi:hypothetical protein
LPVPLWNSDPALLHAWERLLASAATGERCWWPIAAWSVCGYVERALRSLSAAGVEAFAFHDFGENPDTAMVEAGRAFAAPLALDSLIALGGAVRSIARRRSILF